MKVNQAIVVSMLLSIVLVASAYAYWSGTVYLSVKSIEDCNKRFEYIDEQIENLKNRIERLEYR